MIDLDALRKVVERARGWGWEAAYRQDVTALMAEVERLRGHRGSCTENLLKGYETGKAEYDRWRTVALERHIDLANLDVMVTAAMFALSDTGGADGWRPPRGVSPLIDRALDVREARDAERKRADSLALAYRQEQGANDAIKIEAERHRRIADEAVTRIESAEAERAAVVAWLRHEANAPHPIEVGERALSPSGRGLLLLAASQIERGEHRREVE